MKRDITILETAVAALTGELSTLRGRVSRKQPLSATLTVLSGLTLAANSLIVGTGADAAEIQVYDANEFPARSSAGVLEPKPITDFALTLVDDPDDVTARATLGLVIGADVQAWDAGLDALAALPGNGFVVQTGADTFANRLLLGTANEIDVDDSDGSAGDVTFSLPASLTFTGKTITGGTYASATLTAPTIADFSNAQHTHLDAAGGGTLTAAAIGDFSEAVDDRVAALLVAGTNITLTYNDVANTLTIDSAGGAGYTDEQAQDAVGTILVDSATLDFTYDDGVPSITADVLDSPLLGGDTPAFYLDRANHTGTQLAATISDFNEAAQDAVGGILIDSATLDFTYDDALNTIEADVLDSPLLGGQNGAFYLARANHTGTQLAATISDFSEAVDDRVAALLVAGTNITLTYDDGANTLTIDATAGGGALTYWLEATHTAAPNATVEVSSFTPVATTGNADAVVRPKGDGAVLGSVPDNLATGGNKRGFSAVDWQLARDAADEVASGTFASIVGGYANKASGDETFIGGGEFNLASGFVSATIGGSNNQASNNWAATIGGDSLFASGTFSFIGGGADCAASGQSSAIIGGEACTADAANTLASGNSAIARGIIGTAARASGRFASVGDAQERNFQLRRSTTDATAAVLTTDGAAPGATNQIILPNNSLFDFEGSISVRENATGDSKVVRFYGAIKRGANAAATELVGTVWETLVGENAGASGWTIAYSADTTNGGIAITVTGEAAHTLRWKARVTTNEVQG